MKEFVGDDGKLLAEHQQDTDACNDIDIDIESGSLASLIGARGLV